MSFPTEDKAEFLLINEMCRKSCPTLHLHEIHKINSSSCMPRYNNIIIICIIIISGQVVQVAVPFVWSHACTWSIHLYT